MALERDQGSERVVWDRQVVLVRRFGAGQGLAASSSASTTTSDSEADSDTSADSSSDTTATGSLQGQGTSVRITADERNNSLLIKASAQTYRKILGVLRKIDRPPLQVLINATSAEVTLNDNLQYGVQFFLQNNKGLDKTLGFTNGTSIEIAPSAPGLNFVLGALGNNPRVILDALSRETAVRVVSSPAVVVLHNQVATLQVGDEVPITTRSATSLQADQPVIVNEVEFRNTGVILKVTPRINSNGLVMMEIEQELSAVARTSSADTLTPTISQRRFTSTISVKAARWLFSAGSSAGKPFKKNLGFRSWRRSLSRGRTRWADRQIKIADRTRGLPPPQRHSRPCRCGQHDRGNSRKHAVTCATPRSLGHERYNWRWGRGGVQVSVG